MYDAEQQYLDLYAQKRDANAFSALVEAHFGMSTAPAAASWATQRTRKTPPSNAF